MIKFFLLIAGEIILSPVLYLKEFLKRYIDVPAGKLNTRKPVETDNVLIAIHDWAGYDLKRKKTVNNIEFDCGLSYQLNRITNYKGDRRLNLSLTLSDYNEQRDALKYNGLKFNSVPNAGMDFKGYSKSLFNNINQPNRYVLLMNTSVEATQTAFLDDYITFMEQNPQVGLLGISYSARMYQSFIRNNFTPHIQSFFILTTLNVMKEVIAYNNGEFPGQNINNKWFLIRYGEVALSNIVSKLGYQLAVITEENKPFIFPRTESWTKTAYGQWTQPMGEYRFHVKHPNRINSIHK